MGDFCCGGRLEKSVVPGIEIKDQPKDFYLGLPIHPEQVKQLKEKVTVIDTTERDGTLQIDATRFNIRNPLWAQCVSAILPSIQLKLGILPTLTIQAHLHKLLIAEEGKSIL